MVRICVNFSTVYNVTLVVKGLIGKMSKLENKIWEDKLTLSMAKSALYPCLSTSVSSRHIRPIVAPTSQTDRFGLAALTFCQIWTQTNSHFGITRIILIFMLILSCEHELNGCFFTDRITKLRCDMFINTSHYQEYVQYSWEFWRNTKCWILNANNNDNNSNLWRILVWKV